MKTIKLTVLSWILCSLNSFGQMAVEIAENTLKVSGLREEVFYYGFAEGDQLLFNFEEVNGKELKEIEIIELPQSSKFMDYKTKKITDKKLTITKTGIYKFRFANSALIGRICKFKIQRVPASDATKNFNSSVYWRTLYDTTYTTEQEKYLIKSDTTIYNMDDKVAKVHSGGNLNGNKQTYPFTLPDNTISWSYYVGVDQAGQEAYANATKELAKKAAPLLTKIPGYGPMAALALGSASYITSLQKGEDIDYWITDNNNASLYSAGAPFSCYKKGKVINDYSRMTNPLRGMYHVCLANDNAITGVTVTIKITAILVTQQYGTRPIQKMHLAKREEAYLKN